MKVYDVKDRPARTWIALIHRRFGRENVKITRTPDLRMLRAYLATNTDVCFGYYEVVEQRGKIFERRELPRDTDGTPLTLRGRVAMEQRLQYEHRYVDVEEIVYTLPEDYIDEEVISAFDKLRKVD